MRVNISVRIGANRQVWQLLPTVHEDSSVAGRKKYSVATHRHRNELGKSVAYWLSVVVPHLPERHCIKRSKNTYGLIFGARDGRE